MKNKWIKGFYNAVDGWKIFWKLEFHARVHLLAAIMVILAAFWLRVSAIEWVMLLIAIALVISLEMINTALEVLCDRVTDQPDPMIRDTKDLAAGAVLVGALFAALIGIIIFLPRFLE